MLDQTPNRVDEAAELARIDLEAISDGGQSDEAGVYQRKKLGWFFWFCVTWLTAIVLAAIFADFLPLKDPDQTFSGTFKEGPSSEHWFGNDNIGKDVFSRTIFGARRSLGVAVTAQLIGFTIGGTLGLIAGYYRNRIEGVLTGGIDVLLAFPALILLLALVSIFEVRDLFVISLVIGVLSIPLYTRVARANALAVSNREFVTAARAIGTKPTRIMFREIVPNVAPTIFAYAMVAAAAVIVVEGSLSFLGLSVQLPTSSWGNMINQARRDIKVDVWQVVWPSLVLTVTVLSLNQVGDFFQRRSAVRGSSL